MGVQQTWNWLTGFHSESSNASLSMANMTYATASPAATTGGQGNNPVSTWFIFHLFIIWIIWNISLSHDFHELIADFSYL